MTKDCSPIVLSGNVYVNEHLARRFCEYKAPPSFVRGDLIIYAHLDAQGRKNLELRTATKRPTRKTRYLTLSGYFTALLFDGEGWRAFRIERLVGSEGWYTSQSFKEMKIHGVFWKLAKLAASTATWGDDSAYEVVPGAAGETTAATAGSAVVVVDSEPALVESPAAVEVTTVVTAAVTSAGNDAVGSQLELF